MTKFSLRKRLLSFGYAFRGIQLMFKYEHNAWIHLFASCVVLGLGFWLKLSRPEWLFIVFAIGLVLMAEGFNTAIEQLGNAITEDENDLVKKAKDVSAGAVLISAIVSAVIGLMVFIPRLLEKFQ